MSDAIDFLTPVGRFVTGDCFTPRPATELDGTPILQKKGINQGQPRMDYKISLAIPKTDPDYATLWDVFVGAAKQAYPQQFGPTGECTNPQFSFKVSDGDSQIPNSKGIVPCQRTGWAGNWVLHFSTSFAPTCFSKDGVSVITDPSAIPCGSYLRVVGTVRGNQPSPKPGIFLNHAKIELRGFGEPIKGFDIDGSVFANTPAQLPPGASETPLADDIPTSLLAKAPLPASMEHLMGATPTQVPVTPTPVAPAPVPVTPHPQFLTPKTYMINGASYTKEQLMAQGWTEPQIESIPQS